MPRLITTFSLVLQNLKTYQVGLLQAKAYRILNHHSAEALKNAGITNAEWAFLGMLYEKPKGIRGIDAAEELGVEAPFVTRITKKLEASGHVQSAEDKKDSRVKLLCLTNKGRKFVEKTEKGVRDAMRPMAAGLSRKDLLAYLTVLDGIVRNGLKEE